MTPGGPARTYYEACRGRWRAPIALTITDAGALDPDGVRFTVRGGDRVTMHQEGPGFRGVQELSRDVG